MLQSLPKIIFLTWSLFFIPVSASAQSAADEQKKSLSALQEKIETEEQKKKNLERDRKKAEKELKEAQTDIAALTEKIRHNEKDVLEITERSQHLEKEEFLLKERLKKDYGSMAETVLALERLKRMPPELIILRDEPAIETARTALLLQRILPSLNEHATALRHDLTKLENLQTALAENRSRLEKTTAELAQQKDKLDKQLLKRQKDFKNLHTAFRASASRAEALAAEAKTLSELLSKLDAETSVTPSPVKKKGSKKDVRIGSNLWPVHGKLISGYGDNDELGAPVRGIKIKATPSAIVVTPKSGTVKYTGTFRNYGQLVIIEHAQGYHSLIAGMASSNINIGQSINAGEPIGYMTSSSSQNGPLTLYYELRHNGEPVNPALFLADLKS